MSPLLKISGSAPWSNDIRVRNGKLGPQPQNYNKISQQNPNTHQKTTDFREMKKKSNNILILTDGMLKTLRMGELINFYKKEKLTINLFPQKSKTT